MKTNQSNQDGGSSPADAESRVRLERIELARQRMSAGEYDRPEVIETVVAKLISRIAHD
ncbi:MAG: hypothetical protein ABIJ61_08745 [bacterium]